MKTTVNIVLCLAGTLLWLGLLVVAFFAANVESRRASDAQIALDSCIQSRDSTQAMLDAALDALAIKLEAEKETKL